MIPWRKVPKEKFLIALRGLTPEQRLAIQEAAEELARNPHKDKPRPVEFINGDRAIEVVGVWLRYRLDPKTPTVIFVDIIS